MAPLDVDGDGDVDLAVGANGVNGLYKNDGAGQYIRVEAGAFDDHALNTRALVALDVEGDDDILASDFSIGTALYANKNLAEAGVVTSPVIVPSELYPNGGALTGWNVLQVTETLADQTTITYDVLDPATGQPLPGFASLRPNALMPFQQRRISGR